MPQPNEPTPLKTNGCRLGVAWKSMVGSNAFPTEIVPLQGMRLGLGEFGN